MRRNNHSIAKKTPQKTTEKDDDPRIPAREIWRTQCERQFLSVAGGR